MKPQKHCRNAHKLSLLEKKNGKNKILIARLPLQKSPIAHTTPRALATFHMHAHGMRHTHTHAHITSTPLPQESFVKLAQQRQDDVAQFFWLFGLRDVTRLAHASPEEPVVIDLAFLF